MADSILIPETQMSAATRTFTLPISDEGASRVAVRVTRNSSLRPTVWRKEAVAVNVTFEVSVDGGARFIAIGAFTGSGGPLLRPDGSEVLVSFAEFALPLQRIESPTLLRLLRLRLEVSGGADRMEAALRVL